MSIFLALAIVVFVLAASVVGLRILALARRTRQLPELLVGSGFSGRRPRRRSHSV